jgi:hypothetical protein
VRSAGRGDQQETQREQNEHDANPRAAAPPSCTKPPSTAVAVCIARRHWRSRIVTRPGSHIVAASRHRNPLAALQLSELPDLVAVLRCVLARVDALGL